MPEFSGATAKLNLVEPKVFADYVLEQQTATNRLLSSGILTTAIAQGRDLCNYSYPAKS